MKKNPLPNYYSIIILFKSSHFNTQPSFYFSNQNVINYIWAQIWIKNENLSQKDRLFLIKKNITNLNGGDGIHNQWRYLHSSEAYSEIQLLHAIIIIHIAKKHQILQ